MSGNETFGLDDSVDWHHVISDKDNHNGFEIYESIGGISLRQVTTGEPPHRFVAVGPRVCVPIDELLARVQQIHDEYHAVVDAPDPDGTETDITDESETT